MKVVLAQPRGFRAGVVRAVEFVERALTQHGAPVHARNGIVHNRHVVEELGVDDTRAIIAALHSRFSDLAGPDTRDICYAPWNRQTAVRDLTRVLDVIVVVGRGNSSNTNRLREIGADLRVTSDLIADGSQWDATWLGGAEVVGVTAGASAPEVLVDDVIAALARVATVAVSTRPGNEETVSFRMPALYAPQPA